MYSTASFARDTNYGLEINRENYVEMKVKLGKNEEKTTYDEEEIHANKWWSVSERMNGACIFESTATTSI